MTEEKKEVVGVDLDQYQKDKEEFDTATDIVLSADPEKTDEELLKEMDGDGTDEGGEPKKDPVDPDPDTSQAADPDLFGVSPEKDAKKDPEPATEPDKDTPGAETDWLKKAEGLEEELAKEKQKTSSWNGRISAANKKVTDLETKLAEALVSKPAKDDGTDTGKETDIATLERFGNDFPELKNVVDILLKKVDGKVDVTAQAKETVHSDPVVEEGDESKSDLNKAQASIREVHSDLDEMVGSGVLLTWINRQASYIRPTLQTIYEKGSPDDVIKMVTEFKNKTGWKSQLSDTKGDVPAKDQTKADKLLAMAEVNSESGGAPPEGPDKNDFDAAAKEAFK
jgi:cell wall-associated NlpC family hydrolase